MTGQELIKLAESRMFRPAVMNSIINEFVPDPDTFFLTERFLPFKEVDRSLIIDMIKHGAFGRTNPVNLGTEHKRIGIPGFDYKEHVPGHWRESVQFAEDVLLLAMNPQSPLEPLGSGLVTQSLDFLDKRLNTLIEYITAKVVINGKYSEARWGVNYTYDPLIPVKYYRDVTSSPGWTSGGSWATRSSSTPIEDIYQSTFLLNQYGVNPTEIIMSARTAQNFLMSADTQTKVKLSFQLIGQNTNVKSIFQILAGFPLVIDQRLYAEESRLTAASPVGDTVVDVTNASEFAAGDFVTMRNSLGQEEELKISSITANAITMTSATVNAYAIGDRLTAYKQFLPDGYMIIRGETADRMAANNWLSTPSLIKGASWDKPLPGRYTWTRFDMEVPYNLEIGAGIDGGPKISRPNWMVVKV